MRLLYHVVASPSPLGLLFLAATGRGLRYLEYMDRKSLKRTIASHAAENPDATWEPSLLELRSVATQLDEYFTGTRTRFEVALDPVGSEFQFSVWRELLKIPYGTTTTYGEVAKAIGQPKAARAVGLANNQNPLAIVVPCHRVIGADGKLVGYGGGLPRKKYLLSLESRFRRMEPVEGDRVIASATVRVARPAPSPAARTGRAKSPVKAPVKPKVAAHAARGTKLARNPAPKSATKRSVR